jgi:sirohydrochlorin ferrochelatase
MLHSEQFTRAVADQITPADRELLFRRQEGRLSYSSGKGRQTVVVTYTVNDGHLVIRVPEYSEIGWYAPGTKVTLTVDGDQAHPRAVHLRRTATTGRCHQQASETDPRAEQWPAGIHVTALCLPLVESEVPGGHFDLTEFSRAIDASDAESLIAAYADCAEVEVIDPDNPPSSPHVVKGKNAIADWVRSNCQRSVMQRVVRSIDGEDGIAYTVAQVQRDGTQQIAISTAELRDGLVTQQQTVLVRDRAGRQLGRSF